jgi:Na+(H+)/acetate symporter ActP
MDTSTAAWLVIAVALAAANLPFFNDRLFAVVAAKWQRKPLFIRLLEMTALYLVVGAVGFSLEANIGTRFPQTWEFYAISACLFVVLGFPGFIVRYLRKPHG